MVTGGFKTVELQYLEFGWIMLVAEKRMKWGKQGIGL